jgi:hypothetical protein
MVIAGWFVEVDALALAVAGLLLVLAATMLFRPLLSGALTPIPGIGPWIAGQVDNLLAGVERAAAAAGLAALNPLLSLTQRIDTALRAALTMISGAFAQAAWAVAHLAQSVIPHAMALASAHADALYRDATTFAQAAADLASQQGRDAAQSVRDAAVSAAISAATAIEADAIARAQAAADLASQAMAAASDAAATADRDLRNIEDTLGNQIAGVQATGAAAVASLADQIAGQMAGIEQGVRDDVLGLESDISTAGANALAQAIAAATALALPLAAALQDIQSSRCMQSCNILGALGESLGALDGFAVVALVAAAAADPTGVTDALRDDVAPIVRGAADDARAVITFAGSL